LLAELQHLPCFLLMEFVEGCKLSDTVAAVDPVSCVGARSNCCCACLTLSSAVLVPACY
jgi:hypothetical protein